MILISITNTILSEGFLNGFTSGLLIGIGGILLIYGGLPKKTF